MAETSFIQSRITRRFCRTHMAPVCSHTSLGMGVWVYQRYIHPILPCLVVCCVVLCEEQPHPDPLPLGTETVEVGLQVRVRGGGECAQWHKISDQKFTRNKVPRSFSKKARAKKPAKKARAIAHRKSLSLVSLRSECRMMVGRGGGSESERVGA